MRNPQMPVSMAAFTTKAKNYPIININNIFYLDDRPDEEYCFSSDESNYSDDFSEDYPKFSGRNNFCEVVGNSFSKSFN